MVMSRTDGCRTRLTWTRRTGETHFLYIIVYQRTTRWFWLAPGYPGQHSVGSSAIQSVLILKAVFNMARYSSFAFIRGYYTVAADYSKAMMAQNRSALTAGMRD
jgi:hypothetical protein